MLHVQGSRVHSEFQTRPGESAREQQTRSPPPRASPPQDRAVFVRDMVWIGGPYALPPDYAFPPMPAILRADDRMVLLGPPPPGGLLVLNASGLPLVDPWGGGASPSWVAGPPADHEGILFRHQNCTFRQTPPTFRHR